ncbi:MAG TPA: tRNA lysidine(34) synthetase TilS [Anaerohalosphaeraceae bacterium]|nr:tRNA lysidine(34) synthetase TilS [Anaerohalosphaeraceae bacterium]
MDFSAVHLENAVAEWMSRCGLLSPGSRLLLAVSGGIDSMAMLEVLVRLKQGGVIDAELAVGHVNHQLRGAESEADCRFVQEQASARGLPFFSCSVDAAAYARQNRLSIETAARLLRLRALAQMARDWKADAAAAAHQQDDLIETLIFRLLRGTGFRGLCGIRPSSVLEGVRFIRPMLAVSRCQILAYCRERNIVWREDATNADLRFARNRIRHILLPRLCQTAGGNLEADLLRLAESCRRLFEKIEPQVQAGFVSAVSVEPDGLLKLNRTALQDISPVVLGEIFRDCLERLNAGLRDYSGRHYQQLFESVYQPVRRCFHLPDGIECCTSETAIVLRRLPQADEADVREPVILHPGQSCQFGPWRITAELLEGGLRERTVLKGPGSWIEYFDADRITGPIRVRLRKPGDRFVPLGMSQSKRVGKFLTLSKVDSTLRKGVFVVEDSRKILWVVPIRISEEAKIGPQTARILKITLSK